MKTASRWGCVLAVVLLQCAVSGPSASASEADAQAGAPTDVKTVQSAGPPAGQSGMRAYVDPQTGKVGAPPPDQAAPLPSAAEQDASSTSSEGLVVVPAPGGGEMVDLQGRFQTSITATLKPDGTVQTDCRPRRKAPAAGAGR
jgi:hypothetical protein